MDLLTNQPVFFDNNKLLSILQQMSTQIKCGWFLVPHSLLNCRLSRREQGQRIEQLERECATKKVFLSHSPLCSLFRCRRRSRSSVTAAAALAKKAPRSPVCQRPMTLNHLLHPHPPARLKYRAGADSGADSTALWQIDTKSLKPAAQSAEMVVTESPVAQEAAEESSKPAVGRRRKPTLVNASVSQFDRQHQTSQLDMPQRLEVHTRLMLSCG